MKKKQVNGGSRGVYGAYLFKKKDPEIDVVRTLIEEAYGERVKYRHLREIHESGGPTPSCMAGWFFGATLRPTNPALEAAGRAMGYRRTWVRIKSPKPEGEDK